jgi:hypothetical protein
MAATCIPTLLAGCPHKPGSMHVLRLFVPTVRRLSRLARLISTPYLCIYRFQPSNTSCSVRVQRILFGSNSPGSSSCVLAASSFSFFRSISFLFASSPDTFRPLPLLGTQATPPRHVTCRQASFSHRSAKHAQALPHLPPTIPT